MTDNTNQSGDLMIKKVERLFREEKRIHYYNGLHPKEKADINIAEHYFIECIYAGVAGNKPTSALTDDQIRFLARMINDHHTYFAGLPLIGNRSY